MAVCGADNNDFKDDTRNCVETLSGDCNGCKPRYEEQLRETHCCSLIEKYIEQPLDTSYKLTILIPHQTKTMIIRI